MTDITDRLRRWSIATDAVPASDLMDEAAAEIERLRLTDAEREAIHYVVGDVADITGPVENALRGLLERTAR